MRRRKRWFIGLALALLAACAREHVAVSEDIEIAPKVTVSILPGPELVRFRLRNGTSKDIVVDAPNSWNLSMTLEGVKPAMAIDPPEPGTRTTVGPRETSEWSYQTDLLLAKYRPKPQGTYSAVVSYDPNPKGLTPSFYWAITNPQKIRFR